MDKEELIQLVAGVLTDDELEHLKVRDVKRMFGHLKPFISEEEDEDIDEEELSRHVL